MKRGLVIGKFLPLHIGHIGLIEYAATLCLELNILVCSSNSQQISGKIRLEWLKETFESKPNIKIHLLNIIENTFFSNQKDIEPLTRKWATNIQNILPPIDYLFSGETYGDLLAKHLGCIHIAYSQPRIISATEILNDPYKNLQYIADCAKPFFIRNNFTGVRDEKN